MTSLFLLIHLHKIHTVNEGSVFLCIHIVFQKFDVYRKRVIKIFLFVNSDSYDIALGNMMIMLTNIKGNNFFVNPLMIKCIETGGDTVITMVTGEKMLVRDTAEEIQEKILAHKKELFFSLFHQKSGKR